MSANAPNKCRSKETLLYQLVEKYYPQLKAELSRQGNPIPRYVEQEFDAYLQCSCPEHGFLESSGRVVVESTRWRLSASAEGSVQVVVRIEWVKVQLCWWMRYSRISRYVNMGAEHSDSDKISVCEPALGDEWRAEAGLSLPVELGDKQAGLSRKTGQTGAVTLIRRFGSALNLNLHYHLLFLDGAYTQGDSGRLEFRRSREPTNEELTVLAETLARRIGRYLMRRGYLTQDAENNDENSYLADGLTEGGAVEELTDGRPPRSSITYRIAVGPQKGRPVYRLQSLPAQPGQVRAEAGKAGGFSLHAGVPTKKGQRRKLERLRRYVSRPAVSEKRMSPVLRKKFRSSVSSLSPSDAYLTIT